jgi:uncharacterized protein
VDQAAVLREIVSRVVAHKAPQKIILFGSRARGDNTPVSDIDIAIEDPEWTREDVALVHDRVEEEVKTPLKIDMLALHQVSSDLLRRRVAAEGRILYERHAHQRS